MRRGHTGTSPARWGHGDGPCDVFCPLLSISAQSNFAVGAVVNATFGSITELTFYITALIKGSREGNRCYAEIVKSALTGTLVGCVLFVPVSPHPECPIPAVPGGWMLMDLFYLGLFLPSRRVCAW